MRPKGYDALMKIVVMRSPRLLTPLLRRIFKLRKE